MKFNALIPELSVSNLNESKKFYINILGFNLEYDTGELQYPLGRGINFQIITDDVYKIEHSLKRNNIKLFKDIFESQYECDGEIIVENH